MNSNSMDPNVIKHGGPYKIGKLPDGLKAALTKGTHYEIIPIKPMTFETYQSLIRKIPLTPIG